MKKGWRCEESNEKNGECIRASRGRVGHVVASQVYDDGSRYVLFSSQPIPWQVYLKVKHSAEMRPKHVPDSFFQAIAQLIRMEPDVTTIHPEEVMIQGEQDFLLANRRTPKYAEQYDKDSKDIKKRLKYVEDHSKVFVLRVVETLEGTSLGEEIGMSICPRYMRISQAVLAGETKRYVFCYQGHDQKLHAARFLRASQEVRKEKTVMGRFKV